MVTSVWHQVLILVQQVENVTNDHDNAERTKTAQIGTSAQSLMESQKALDRLERRHTRVWQRVAHVGVDKKKFCFAMQIFMYCCSNFKTNYYLGFKTSCSRC